MAKLEFFFDCSSPWTYLAFTRVQDVIARTKAEAVWCPILVGGVFNAVNKDVYERRANPDPRKASYSGKDLQDWAKLAGIQIGKPQPFPVNAVLEMRCCLAADEKGKLIPFAREAFKAYWGDLKDVSKPEAIAGVCRAVGLNPGEILERAAAPYIKDKLRANTEAVIARGGFGSPTMFVNGTDMYFGNDRLPLVEAALMRAP
ncbi:MAG: 2-hydroxychromene-2-carboxylate isomerase [Proteobacteria bacterium]|nr:2-hydroxychromene-2-carboxylate isomerase [Pseudomonadota bacterium]